MVLALIWTISAIFSHRHLKNSGGTHDPCDVRTVGRTGQSVGLVCSGEGLDERNEYILHLKSGLFWISQKPNLIIVLLCIVRRKMVTTVSETGNLFVNE